MIFLFQSKNKAKIICENFFDFSSLVLSIRKGDAISARISIVDDQFEKKERVIVYAKIMLEEIRENKNEGLILIGKIISEQFKGKHYSYYLRLQQRMTLYYQEEELLKNLLKYNTKGKEKNAYYVRCTELEYEIYDVLENIFLVKESISILPTRKKEGVYVASKKFSEAIEQWESLLKDSNIYGETNNKELIYFISKKENRIFRKAYLTFSESPKYPLQYFKKSNFSNEVVSKKINLSLQIKEAYENNKVVDFSIDHLETLNIFSIVILPAETFFSLDENQKNKLREAQKFSKIYIFPKEIELGSVSSICIYKY